MNRFKHISRVIYGGVATNPLPATGEQMSVEQGIVRILDQAGKPQGMGFVVGERQIVTCVHVVDKSHPPAKLLLIFH